MPANRMNYLVIYEGHSQVYGAGTDKIALASPPPEGCELEQKHVLFVTYEPDNEEMVVYEIPKDEVMSAEIIYPKTMTKRVINEN